MITQPSRADVMAERLNGLHGSLLMAKLPDETYDEYMRVLEALAVSNGLTRTQPEEALPPRPRGAASAAGRF